MARSSHLSRNALAVVLAALAGAPVSAQVKAAFPGVHRADGPTPLERSLPAPPAPQAMRPGQPATGIVGGTGFGRDHGVIVGGSGLTANGSFADGKLKVDFHLGAQPGAHGGRVFCPGGVVWSWPLGYFGGGYPYGSTAGYYDNSDQRYAVVDGALVQPEYGAAPAPAAPAGTAPPPPTDAQLGAALLRAGDAAGAVDKFRMSLRDYPGDGEVMRGLGVALLAKGQAEQGVAMMSMAYRTDPSLAGLPLPRRELFESDDVLRRTLQKAVASAHKLNTGPAWLTVAVLMQAEGRDSQARRMIDRAADQGLDAALAKRFRTALGG